MSATHEDHRAKERAHEVPLAVAVRVAERLAEGAGEALGEVRFLPLVALESGARVGLDAAGRWVLAPDDGRAAVVFDPAAAHLFHEILEQKRARFDDALETAARAAGLPESEVLAMVLGFPAVPVVRAVLAKEHAYLTRLALEWAAPTELRELRDAIRAAGRAPNMPLAVRQLAERLTVPD